MAGALIPTCDKTRYAMEMLLPYRCKYCTRQFQHFATYQDHKRAHELRYHKFWDVHGQDRGRTTLTPNVPQYLFPIEDNSGDEVIAYLCKGEKFRKLLNSKKIQETGRSLPCQYMFPPYKSMGVVKGGKNDVVKNQRKGGVRIGNKVGKKVGKKVCLISNKLFNKAHVNEKSHFIKANGKDTSGKFCCQICAKVFHKADILALHERSHSFKTPEKKSPPKIAEGACMTKAAKVVLVDVIGEIIEGVSLFQCKHCTQGFADRGEWELHERSHTFMNSNQKILTLKIRETVQAFADSVKTEQLEPTQKSDSIQRSEPSQKSDPHQKTVQSSDVKIKMEPGSNGCDTNSNDIPYDMEKEALLESLSLRRVGAEPTRLQKVTKQLQHQLKKNTLAVPIIKPTPFQGVLLPCCYCSMKFKTVSELAHHDKIHAKRSASKRPFQCGLCGKYFTQSGSLRAHERIHTGERPYVCNLCGRSFHESGKLRRHQRTHTGEKPYTCSWCGRKFAQNGTRKSHEKTHRDMYGGAPTGMSGLSNSWGNS